MDILLSPQLLAAALITGVLYALISLGLNLIYGTMRLLNVAHGDLVMIGAYVAFMAFSLFNVGPLISMFAAAIICGGLGWLAYRSVLQNLLANSEILARLEENSLLLFFGISVVVQNLVILFFTADRQGYEYLSAIVEIADVRLTGARLAVLIVGSVISIAAVLYLRFSLFGLAMNALIQNRDASAVVGINVDRVQMYSLVIGFGITGLAGALISVLEPITPVMGFPYTMSAFVVIILGGLGNLWGGFLAGLLLGFLEIFGVAVTGPEWRSVLVYGIFIGILIFRPQGLLGHGRIAR
ncbi:MAG: branched-chain amino acid ABC transporter permease [Rhodospirillales bacterium]|nr:branched-chain amino acid ABC transporter permease [Rhodospirillales bacterium]MDP7623823.1 branched-chain amino acid ABC transporter permease [Rhodospirillales bacterium]